MSRDMMMEAKDLIDAQRYAEARAMLKRVNHPIAQEWLKQLDKLGAHDNDIEHLAARAAQLAAQH